MIFKNHPLDDRQYICSVLICTIQRTHHHWFATHSVSFDQTNLLNMPYNAVLLCLLGKSKLFLHLTDPIKLSIFSFPRIKWNLTSVSIKSINSINGWCIGFRNKSTDWYNSLNNRWLYNPFQIGEAIFLCIRNKLWHAIFSFTFSNEFTFPAEETRKTASIGIQWPIYAREMLTDLINVTFRQIFCRFTRQAFLIHQFA